ERTSRTASSTGPNASTGSGTRSRATSAALRIGRSTTVPTPSTSWTSIPIPRTVVMMSAKSTAASTPWRRTGCSVTSAQSSGVPATSKKEWRSRIARDSGSERPAWRMYQTGVRSTGSERAARTRSGAAMQGRVSLARATRPCRDIHSGAVEPLVPVWRGSTLAPQRAGARTTARVVLENAGGATWRSRGADGLQVSYHWLHTHGNAIVWDGTRTAFPHPVAPGETIELDLPLDAPRPPGRYVLRLDLVEEHRFWLSEIGVPPHDLEVDVAPLIEERRLAVVVHGGSEPRTDAALALQDDPVVAERPTATAHLVAGAEPAPDWSRLVLDAHAEGWAAVGPAIAPLGGRLQRRRRSHASRPWRARGRKPHARPAR